MHTVNLGSMPGTSTIYGCFNQVAVFPGEISPLDALNCTKSTCCVTYSITHLTISIAGEVVNSAPCYRRFPACEALDLGTCRGLRTALVVVN